MLYILLCIDLISGAIPLQSMHHMSRLSLDLGIKYVIMSSVYLFPDHVVIMVAYARAVVSVNQAYELGCRTVAGLPVQHKEWEVTPQFTLDFMVEP